MLTMFPCYWLTLLLPTLPYLLLKELVVLHPVNILGHVNVSFGPVDGPATLMAADPAILVDVDLVNLVSMDLDIPMDVDAPVDVPMDVDPFVLVPVDPVIDPVDLVELANVDPVVDPFDVADPDVAVDVDVNVDVPNFSFLGTFPGFPDLSFDPF